jgi:molybdopterin/thiamine biosynthesis adenylyltransferase
MPDKKIIQAVRQKATGKTGPDGTRYDSLAVTSVAFLAEATGIASRFIEITALENDIVPERYTRNMQTLSIADQLSLLKATVCIVGLGGLGGTVTELLARLGTGALILVDGDIFDDSNLNRQILSTQRLLATPKATAAATRVKAINASVEITARAEFIDTASARQLINDTDVVVDCLDDIKTRFILEDAARDAGIPMVSAAVAGHIGQITTIFPEDTGLRLIYGEPGSAIAAKGAETLLGTPPYTVTMAASLEVSQITKVLLKQKGILRNQLLFFDLDQNTFEILQLE